MQSTSISSINDIMQLKKSRLHQMIDTQTDTHTHNIRGSGPEEQNDQNSRTGSFSAAAALECFWTPKAVLRCHASHDKDVAMLLGASLQLNQRGHQGTIETYRIQGWI